jgi:hypothetical protein
MNTRAADEYGWPRLTLVLVAALFTPHELFDYFQSLGHGICFAQNHQHNYQHRQTVFAFIHTLESLYLFTG